ncbi:MAG: mannose-1-phosphate guanylyltransferase [Bacteroidales bacterium]|nr:mannose-1-phosphate guanylyltransferase [Bacteroidales bacterium]
MDTHVVIMAGGIGSRFWPMSTPDLPKQFVDIMGVGKTLIQMTVDRFSTVCPMTNFWVVTGEKYVGLVKEQLPDLPEDNILAEPAARNTAPCIAYACWKIRKRHPEANIVVTPSDALVINVEEFRRVISTALDFTCRDRRIVTIGIKPSRPETGYGYIKEGELAEGEVYKVDSFKEKPCLEVAKQYLSDGGYLWNAGIFVWNVDTIVCSLREYVPGLASQMDEMAESFYTESETEVVGRIFPVCERISIDYAVMEKADCIYTIPADFGWSDLGTWGSLRTLMDRNEEGNAVVGNDVRLYDCRNCIVHVPDLQRVVIQGLEGCIVAQHGDRLIVCSLDREQDITNYSK